jgi:hypothetical protein
MPQPRIPQFLMPEFELPSLLPLPAPGTRLSIPLARALYESLIQCSVRIMLQREQFREAWEAHYAQRGRPAPPLIDDRRRRPRRTAAQRPDTSNDTPPIPDHETRSLGGRDAPL